MNDKESNSDRILREMFERSLADSGRIELKGWKKWLFRFKLNLSLSYYSTPRPFFMLLNIAICKIRLAWFESREPLGMVNHRNLEVLKEQIESLRFATYFGRQGNKQQREWLFEQIEIYGFTNVDARFLVWNNVIWLHGKEIQFNRWLWISGLAMNIPVFILMFLGLFSCYCCASPVSEKVKMAFEYIAVSSSMFIFFKTMTFDVYRVGQRYFIPNWSSRFTLKIS